MKYVSATKRPTGIQLAELEKFYLNHGKDAEFIPTLRGLSNDTTIRQRFEAIIDRLNMERCQTCVPNGVGVQNMVFSEPYDSLLPQIEPLEDDMTPVIYTVCIHNFIEPECMPWVSAFPSREAAEEFMAKAEERIRAVGAENLLRITMDSGRLGSEQHLDEITEVYSMDRDE